tara:strand:+ start:5177 stop:5296 length:120 start_codon:yes stop_codon:yes gene_type:complete
MNENKIKELELRIKNLEEIQEDVLNMIEFLAKKNNVITD